MSDRIHDLVGIGFGPSNLALAIALHERDSGLDRIFLEARPGFAWHPGMMIQGADMQVSFLKDLVSLHNPASHFSFLCYLHDKDRLERFINRKTFFPSRVEFNDYLSWAAAKLNGICAYDQRVTAIEPAERQGVVTHLRIHAENSAGKRSLRLARQIVLAPGGEPNWPEPFRKLRGKPQISHSNDFVTAVLPHVATGQRIAVLGAGQSAAEIFAELASHPAAPAVDLIQRGHALKPSDDSPFVNEIFGADHTELMFRMDSDRRKALLQDLAGTNYAVADLDLLQKIYDLLYEQEVGAGSRLRLLRDTHPIAARALPVGIALALEGPAGRHEINYDHVILGTGYRRQLSASVLSGLSAWMQTDRPDRFYRLPMRSGFRPAIYVQGYSEATHGLSDTLLSILAVRAQEIAAATETFRTGRLIAAE